MRSITIEIDDRVGFLGFFGAEEKLLPLQGVSTREEEWVFIAKGRVRV